MDIVVLGVDLGKNSCSVVGLDATGCVTTSATNQTGVDRRISSAWSECIVAMEACCGAHHLARRLAAEGQVRLMSPEYVRPYVKAQKNDDRDAEPIVEAATPPTMRFVEIKSEAQLDMQSPHRDGNALCPSEQRSSISFGHC